MKQEVKNMKRGAKRKLFTKKLLTIIALAVSLLSVSFACGATAYAEEVYEAEPIYEVTEEEEDQTTVEDNPQAYREELRQDAMAKEEWKEICQKWQNFKKFILDSITTLIQR